MLYERLVPIFDPPKPRKTRARRGVDCGMKQADVRAAVATIKAGAGVSDKRAVEILEAMARGNGAKPEQIASAKRCLSSSSSQAP